ncbi:uncharacterized protein PFL1_01642 [Pseudozyma flocculosa PF-1]|uniref:uncharacterized protein n=1 Tax=Pseudozyma flocculosa PF-1 TaxID=1277687 RepID=UPI00045604B5|nr:uncharacterized protein PFL1_01642 [Pseudozyma flocculosa PF-1]EPQ30741.1 hypothetical protein PFL1_01642 [Pseudozyma flocculosa PF-1]
MDRSRSPAGHTASPTVRLQAMPVQQRAREVTVTRAMSSALPAIRTTYLASLGGPDSASDIETPSTSASTSIATPHSALRALAPSLRPFHKPNPAEMSPSYVEPGFHRLPDAWTLRQSHDADDGTHESLAMPSARAQGAASGGLPALALHRATVPDLTAELGALHLYADQPKPAAGFGEAYAFAPSVGSPSALSSASRTSTSESCNPGSSFVDRLHPRSSDSEVSSASQHSSDSANVYPFTNEEAQSRLWLDPASEWPSRGGGAVHARQPNEGSRSITSPCQIHEQAQDFAPDAPSGSLSDSPRLQRRVPASPCFDHPADAASAAATSPSACYQPSPSRDGDFGDTRSARRTEGVRRHAVSIEPEQLLTRLLSVSCVRQHPPQPSQPAWPSSYSLLGCGSGAAGGLAKPNCEAADAKGEPRLSERRTPSSNVDGSPDAATSGGGSCSRAPFFLRNNNNSNRPLSDDGGHYDRAYSVRPQDTDKEYKSRPTLSSTTARTSAASTASSANTATTAAAAAELRTATAPAVEPHHQTYHPTLNLDQLHTSAWCSSTASAAQRPPSPSPAPPSASHTASAPAAVAASGAASSAPPISFSSRSAAIPIFAGDRFTHAEPSLISSPPLPSPSQPLSASTLTPGTTFAPLSTPSLFDRPPSPLQTDTPKTIAATAGQVASPQPSDCAQERSGDCLALPFDTTSPVPPLVIDIRSLEAYLAIETAAAAPRVVTGRIRSSVNVSLPKLILRRLQRSCAPGSTASVNLPLKSFVTTAMGKRRFDDILGTVAGYERAQKRRLVRPADAGTDRTEDRHTAEEMSTMTQALDTDSLYWKADVVVVYDEQDQQRAPDVTNPGRTRAITAAKSESPNEILLRALERMGPSHGSDRGGGVYYVRGGDMAEVRAKLGPRFWLDSEEEGARVPDFDRAEAVSSGQDRRAASGKTAVGASRTHQHHRPARLSPAPSPGPASPLSGASGTLAPPLSLSTVSSSDGSRSPQHLSPLSASLSPSALSHDPHSSGLTHGSSPPPSLASVAVQPGKPKRPSLARLDTSERIRAADGSSGSGAALSKKSPNALARLQLDTAVPRRSATLSALEAPPTRSLSRGSSPQARPLHLAAPSARASEEDDVPPTPVPTESLQSLCRLQAQLPPSASSFGDMSLPPGARGTFGFGAHDDGGQPYPADTAFEVSTILPGFLYLGPNVQTRGDVGELERLGVKRILNMAYEIEEGGADDLQLDRRFDRYLKIPMTDSVEAVGVQKSIDEACRFLDDARLHSAPTYVHCKAGKSRSVTVVIAYLIHAHHWTLRKSYNFVVERRNAISPNIGFVAELMKYEERELHLAKSGGIIGGGSGGGGGGDSDEGEGQTPSLCDEAEGSKKGGRAREHARESMPPLGRQALAALSSGLGPSASAPDMPRFDERLGGSGDMVQGQQQGQRQPSEPPHPSTASGASRATTTTTAAPSSSSSSSSSSSRHPSPLLGFADSLASLGGPNQRQVRVTEAGEVRGPDGRYRSRRPPPVDEVNMAPGRRATMAGLGK